jgi:hypothetical protein
MLWNELHARTKANQVRSVSIAARWVGLYRRLLGANLWLPLVATSRLDLVSLSVTAAKSSPSPQPAECSSQPRANHALPSLPIALVNRILFMNREAIGTISEPIVLYQVYRLKS